MSRFHSNRHYLCFCSYFSGYIRHGQISFQLVLLRLCGVTFPFGGETLLIDPPPFLGVRKAKPLAYIPATFTGNEHEDYLIV